MTKKVLYIIIGLLVVGAVGGAFGYFFVYNKPHRNIERLSADYELHVDDIFQALDEDLAATNEKFFAADILAIEGQVYSKMAGADNLIIELTGDTDIIVNISLHQDYLTDDTLRKAFDGVVEGANITIKGVYTGGDEDLFPGAFVAKLKDAYIINAQ